MRLSLFMGPSFALFLFPFSLLLFPGCANRMSVKADYDFSKVRRMAVPEFSGPGGDAVANEFVRQLVATRLEVTERREGADLVLSGAVTEFKPGDKLMVFLGDTTTVSPGGQTVVVTNPVVSLSGTQVTTQGAAMGLPNTQVVSVSASVGIIAKLLDAGTGEAVWSDSYTYEGLDIQSALDAVVGAMVRSMGRVIPAARREGLSR